MNSNNVAVFARLNLKKNLGLVSKSKTFNSLNFQIKWPLLHPSPNDGLEDAKKIDLAEPREEPRLTWIATDLSQEEEELLISTLKKYKDVFAWSYKDLKGVDPAICQHTIPMQEDESLLNRDHTLTMKTLTIRSKRKLTSC